MLCSNFVLLSSVIKLMKKNKYKDATIITHSGRKPDDHYGFVNTPVYRGSTILSKNVKEFKDKSGKYQYGSLGTPSSESLENNIKDLEQADGCKLTSSGRSAILLALMSVLEKDDHILLSDSVYHPTKIIVNNFLSKMGISSSYFSPENAMDIETFLQSNTKVIFLESPGSLTFEVLDIPFITKIAKKNKVLTIIDNTWATPLYFKPYNHGIDISVHAATKYIVGHSDAMLGAVTAIGKSWELVKNTYDILRLNAGTDDVYLGDRGIKTMKVRMDHQLQSAIEIASYLSNNNKIEKVFYPPLVHDDGHSLWKRDFTGGASLFTFITKEKTNTSVENFIDNLELFGIGASWGGYESLIMPIYPSRSKTNKWGKYENSMIRMYVGLEDTSDLIKDIKLSLNLLSV
jgi:cysteine-S-conjugate beta-lyase